MATSQRKSVQIKISLTPKLYEDLRNVSEALGQAPATLAGLAVGQYVAQMGSSLGASQRAVETMVDRIDHCGSRWHGAVHVKRAGHRFARQYGSRAVLQPCF